MIYPTKEGLFVHIYPDFTGARDHYIAIEPTVVTDICATSCPQVEAKLVAWAEEIGRTEDKEEKKKLLIELIDQICTTTAPNPHNGKAKQTKILVTPRQLEAIRYIVHPREDRPGRAPAAAARPLYRRHQRAAASGTIFIEHKIFKSVQSSIVFPTYDDVDDFAVWLGEWIKSPVTVRNPLVDAVLPDGSRINIVYGREISKRGSNFTIRKFSGDADQRPGTGRFRQPELHDGGLSVAGAGSAHERLRRRRDGIR